MYQCHLLGQADDLVRSLLQSHPPIVWMIMAMAGVFTARKTIRFVRQRRAIKRAAQAGEAGAAVVLPDPKTMRLLIAMVLYGAVVCCVFICKFVQVVIALCLDASAQRRTSNRVS